MIEQSILTMNRLQFRDSSYTVKENVFIRSTNNNHSLPSEKMSDYNPI